MFTVFRSLILSVSLFGLPAAAQVIQPSDQSTQAVRISAFSGKPVPRFESLKYSAVHGRIGPSLEYPIAWRYERQGLPVMVIKESRDWRMVRDPAGDEVWMHERTLGAEPSVMVYGDTRLPLLKSDDADARVIAQIEPGAIATLIGCEGDYCEIYINHRRGFAEKAKLWGAPGTVPESVEMNVATAAVSDAEMNGSH
tara:strand:+ start:7003 stop:7593 length:591 start_codon:yes stop_codon:yes gene_type:complete